MGVKRIKIDKTYQRISVTITSKILLEQYPKLITKETINTALQNLNKPGYTSFNPDLVIYLSTVSYFDLTRDVFLSGPTEDYLRDLRILGNTHNYRIKNHKSGIELYSEAPSNKHRLNVYSKYDELCLNNLRNRILWKYINKEDFQNSLRFEANFDNPEIIIKYFDINQGEDIMLTTILNKSGNILYNYCCNMISSLKIPKKQLIYLNKIFLLLNWLKDWECEKSYKYADITETISKAFLKQN